MATWRSSTAWRPRRFGWFVSAELPAFLAWLLPAMVGLVLMGFEQAATGETPSMPRRLADLGLPGEYWQATFLYSPLWGFPAIVAGLALRAGLLARGWFGWASAVIAGLCAGLAVPVMLGANLWLAGPLYGAANLLTQHVIFKVRRGSDFDSY